MACKEMCGLKQLSGFTSVIKELKGRDKVNKWCQYAGKILFYVLTQMDSKADAAKFKKLSSGIGNARKVDRLFRSTEELQKAISTINKKDSEDFTKYLTVLSALFYAMRWFNDNKVFLGRIKVLESVDVKQANIRANSFWLYGLVIVVYLFTLKMGDTYKKRDATSDEAELEKVNNKLLLQRVQFLGYCCDIVVAVNNSGYLEQIRGSKLNDGQVGVLGLVSASTVLYRLWPAK